MGCSSADGGTALPKAPRAWADGLMLVFQPPCYGFDDLAVSAELRRPYQLGFGEILPDFGLLQDQVRRRHIVPFDAVRFSEFDLTAPVHKFTTHQRLLEILRAVGLGQIQGLSDDQDFAVSIQRVKGRSSL